MNLTRALPVSGKDTFAFAFVVAGERLKQSRKPAAAGPVLNVFRATTVIMIMDRQSEGSPTMASGTSMMTSGGSRRLLSDWQRQRLG